ncbi:hypothetical protein [Psychroflexus halocasei]|uniref:hypothetical protein n=1 Tax=Psychroflexus halocasei TaxID=908615 RepID=UPI000B840708|nr:hypothetical protein [Psychroflexus halocasei]
MKAKFKDFLSIKPFVFQRIFLLWALLGVISGIIAGIYWLVLDFIPILFASLTSHFFAPRMPFIGSQLKRAEN